MDPNRTGALIRQLRTAMHLTQRELAERIHVSDKAVSKWERGHGCPDISLLTALADVFGTDVRVLLAGEIAQNEGEQGNMKKLRFYICKKCGNIVTAASEAAVTCCGSGLTAPEPRAASEHEKLRLTETGGEWYVTADHPMTKAHHIVFAAYVSDSTVMLFRQYPEWDFQVTMPLCRSGRLYWYCTECGLLYQDIRS